MCTVSYLPLSGGGIILTSTRDEKILRKPANLPVVHEIHGQEVYFPQDQDASGTWIASGPDVDTLCLLNGGLIPHEPNPPYRKSRGLVLLDYYRYNDLSVYLDSYNFSRIEPFTLLILGGTVPSLDEIRWDGHKIHHQSLPHDLPGIWSSVTLYTEDVIRLRKDWFENWLRGKPDFTIESTVSFHKTAGTGDAQNDVLMNRDNTIRTVSITSLVRQPGRHEFYYEDIIDPNSVFCTVQ